MSHISWKLKNASLKSKIRVLQNKVSISNSKYEEVSKNVKGFNIGKENFLDLLSFQHNDISKHGLGYKKIQ